MSMFGSRESALALLPRHKVPVVVRLWEEDGVWNASAFDLSVAVFGGNIEEAKKNFEEALDSHFELLSEMGRAKEAVCRLRDLAAERGFYEKRMKVQETVTTFSIPHQMEECFA